jgi:hypothetical protein
MPRWSPAGPIGQFATSAGSFPFLFPVLLDDLHDWAVHFAYGSLLLVSVLQHSALALTTVR